MPRLTILIAVLLATAMATQATVIHVPSEQPTIQAGVNAASSGDTVLLSIGTYVGVGNRDIDISKQIVLMSASTPDSVIIDCQNAGAGFYISGPTGVGPVIEGITIINGNGGSDGNDGGAIDNRNKSIIVRNCIFVNNTANYGGAIYCNSLTVPSVFERCTFVGNRALHDAGSVYYENGCVQVSFSRCILYNNTVNGAAPPIGGNGGVLTCCDIYGNSPGDWIGSLSSQANINGNLSANPLFLNSSGDFRLSSGSPCLPEHNSCRELIGALGPDHMPCTINVPADQPTIQAGIDAALNGDTVLVADGTYAGEGNRDIELRGQQIVLRSVNGPNNCIIDCHAGVGNCHRGFYVHEGEDARTWIEGFTITGAFTDWEEGGCGMFIAASSPTVANCIITGNTFGNNIDELFGGGGIAVVNSSSPTFLNCTISNNVHGDHSGVYVGPDCGPAFYGCNIVNNQGAYAVWIVGGSKPILFSECLVSGNTGSGIHAYYASQLSLVQCIVAVNSGPGCWFESCASVVMTQCTVVSNGGNGINIYDHLPLYLSNTIIAFNAGYALYCDATSTINVEGCDIYANDSGDWVGCLANWDEWNDNLSRDPNFCNREDDILSIDACSPCSPDHNSRKQLIGALPVACQNDYCGPVWYVATDGSDESGDGSMVQPFNTLGRAIDAAFDNDTLLVGPGSYSGPGNVGVGITKRYFTILGSLGEDRPILELTGSDTGLIINLASNSSFEVNIRVTGLVFHGDGRSTGISVAYFGGGSFYNNLEVSKCLFESDSLGISFGVLEGQAEASVQDCVFKNNFTGVSNYWGPFTNIRGSGFEANEVACFGRAYVSDCTFRNDHNALVGLAEYESLGYEGYFTATRCFFENIQDTVIRVGLATHISQCTIRNNSGLIAFAPPSSNAVLTIDDCNISDNLKGILLLNSARLIMTNTSYVRNGSGITMEHLQRVDVTDCLFTQNGSTCISSTEVIPYPLNIRNCTFWGNCADAVRIANDNGTVAFERNLVCGNTGAGLSIIEPGAAVNRTISCNDFHGNIGGNYVGIDDQTGIEGNITLDPLFCDVAIGNFSLCSLSPCATANNSCGQLMGRYDVGCSLSTSVFLKNEVDSSHVLNHTPEVLWSWFPNLGFQQTDFEIAVGTDNNWTYAEMWNPAPFVSPNKSVVYAGAALVDGTTYYARERSKLNGSWTPWYETSFRMNSLPTKPVVTSPLSGSILGTQPTLFVDNSTDAEGDLLSYQFEVYVNPNISPPVVVSGLVPQGADSTGWTLDAVLTENETYLWRVRAWDGFEYSDWSSYFSFVVNSNPEAPSIPTAITPVGANLILYDMLPAFSWTEATDPDPFDEVKYRLELSFNQGFTLVVPFDGLTQPSYQMTDSLLFDQQYWWRVKAIDKTGLYSTSEPSDVWTWTLGDINRNHVCTIGDVSILVDHLFISGTPIDPPRVGDLNATCDITIGDVSLMIDHLFISGAQFKVGCE